MKPAGTAAAAAASVADAKAQRGVQPVPLPGGLPEHCARANPEDKSTPLIPGYYTENRKWGAHLTTAQAVPRMTPKQHLLLPQHLPRRKVMKAWKRKKQPLEQPKLGRTCRSCFLRKKAKETMQNDPDAGLGSKKERKKAIKATQASQALPLSTKLYAEEEAEPQQPLPEAKKGEADY